MFRRTCSPSAISSATWTIEVTTNMAQMNMIQALNSALNIMLSRDPGVIVIGQDVGFFGGVYGLCRRIYAGQFRKHLATAERLADELERVVKGQLASGRALPPA